MNLLEAAKQHPDRIAELITKHLDNGQGLRIGESSVVSRFEHMIKVGWRGKVIVLTNQNADRYLHLDVFHDPVQIQESNEELTERIRSLLSIELSGSPMPDFHIHHLPTRVSVWICLTPSQYPVLANLVASVEDYLTERGLGLRKVEKLMHLTGSCFANHQARASLLSMGIELGSVQGGLELLEAMDPRTHSKPSLTELSALHGGLTFQLNRMITDGLVKRNLWGGYQLTPTGMSLLDYAQVHIGELESEYRKVIRKNHVDKTFEQVASRQKSAVDTEVSDRGRVIKLAPGEWAGSIAITETVLAATVNRFLRGEKGLLVTRDDLYVHRRFRKIPQDILLIIDASTSMRGPRFRAAVRLAEYLVLQTRERVAVVIFQHRRAEVASGFTRNHAVIQKGLWQVKAGGLTPLAGGILEGVRLIKAARAKNPLVILITDGVPTVALLSADPVQDSLTVAGRLPDVKARFAVIGLKPDANFLHDLAVAGNGSAYIVDDLQHDSLISIVRYEKNRQ